MPGTSFQMPQRCGTRILFRSSMCAGVEGQQSPMQRDFVLRTRKGEQTNGLVLDRMKKPIDVGCQRDRQGHGSIDR